MSLLSKRQYKQFLTYTTNHVVSRIVLSRIRLHWYRKVMQFEIGNQTSILTDFKVSQPLNITIGHNTVINNSCRFDNRFRITIGNNTSISYGTMILTKGHDIDSTDFRTWGAPVTIEDFVWICTQAIILPGVTIGKGAVVLTGSVVTQNIPPFHVVGGNPARFIRERPQDLHYQLCFDTWVPFFG